MLRVNLAITLLQIKYGVVWRYPHSAPEDIPANIKLLTWLPQQDLLSHTKTKLFITHCGANGQFEALYHAVPMIGMPLFAEQHYNAKRAQHHGFGETINILDFKAHHVIKTINRVISGRYQENIQRASTIFRNPQMAPQERATWWIEHVLQYGGAHLRAHALDMPWYQYLMLDILLFVLVNLLIVFFFVCKVCSLCLKVISGSNSDQLNSNNIRRSKKRPKSD